MLLMRSEADAASRPLLLFEAAAAAAAAATEFCIIEVENRRGFSKRGLDKAMALAAMAAKKLGLSFEPATTPGFPPEMIFLNFCGIVIWIQFNQIF